MRAAHDLRITKPKTDAMFSATYGCCSACGKQFKKQYMSRHLRACRAPSNVCAQTSRNIQRSFTMSVVAEQKKAYWMILQIQADATLRQLDMFLRTFWVECFWHMSCFGIKGTYYEAVCEDPFLRDLQNMRVPIDSVLKDQDRFTYTYDYMKPTVCKFRITDEQYGSMPKRIIIRARNVPPEITCGVCGIKPARIVYRSDHDNSSDFICVDCVNEKCIPKKNRMPMDNTPRMGIFDEWDARPEEILRLERSFDCF